MFLSKFSKQEKNIFLFSSLLFFAFYILRILSNKFILSDSMDYFETAAILLDGGYFQPAADYLEAVFLTKRPIVYPLFLSLFTKFRIEFILLIQTLFGIFNLYLSVCLLKKLNLNISYLFFVFLIVTPSIFIYTQLIMTEWLVMTFLMLLANLLFSEFSKKRFIYIQILTVLLAFTKPVFYPFIYFNLIFFCFYLYKKRTLLFTLFLPIIVLVSYLYFNEYRTGYKHFSSMQNINLVNYNLYLFKSNMQGTKVADAWRDTIQQKLDVLVTTKEKNEFLNKSVRDEIKTNFFQYSWYHFYTSIRGVFDPGRFDIMTFFSNEDGTQGFLSILNSDKSVITFLKTNFNFVFFLLIPILIGKIIKVVLAFRYIFLESLKGNYLKIYLFVLLIYTFLISGPVNCSRYLMPFEFLYIIFAVASFKDLGVAFKTKTRPELSNSTDS